MGLDTFFEYKNQLVKDLVTNDRIVELITDKAASSVDAASLIYTQIFPYEYIPDTVEQGKTFICCDVDVQKTLNSLYLSPCIYVWVFTHKSLLRLEKGGVRTDALCAAITDAINGSHYYGLGELDLYSVRRFAPISDYQGKLMTFNATEFNRLSPNKHTIPSNRKSRD